MTKTIYTPQIGASIKDAIKTIKDIQNKSISLYVNAAAGCQIKAPNIFYNDTYEIYFNGIFIAIPPEITAEEAEKAYEEQLKTSTDKIMKKEFAKRQKRKTNSNLIIVSKNEGVIYQQ